MKRRVLSGKEEGKNQFKMGREMTGKGKRKLLDLGKLEVREWGKQTKGKERKGKEER